MIEPKINGFKIFVIKVNSRGNWIFVELQAGVGLTGVGEASHGCGFSQASTKDDIIMRHQVERFYRFLEGESPFAVENFRRKAWKEATDAGLPAVTAFSGLEQAMCDLASKSSGVPIYELLGGKVRKKIPVYANINRAIEHRTPDGFAIKAEKAIREGFRSIKIAPFDDFPNLDCSPGEIEAALENGIARIEATRKAIGANVDLMVDCHSKFNRRLGIQVAQLLSGINLHWYEEPVAPEALEDTIEIHRAIPQRLAGGETLFGKEGFGPLCRQNAVDIIMPDVKHCGGIFETKKIALLAESHSIKVSPHNPSGPISMAASAQVASTLNNFEILEHAWGETDWRHHLIHPEEEFTNGILHLSDQPGLGCQLSQRILEQQLTQ